MRVKGELLDDLSAVAVRFGAQLSDAAQHSLFDRLDWFALTQQHINPDARPLIAHAEADGHDAWMFLRKTGKASAEGLSSWYTLAYRPVFSPGAPDAARLKLLYGLGHLLRRELATFRIEPIPEADGTAGLLQRAFGETGWVVHAGPKTGHWYTTVGEGGFAAFWTARPGQLRSTHDRRVRKFPMDIHIHDRLDAALWSDYQAVFADSWKGDEGSLPFLHAMAEAAAQRGALRLGMARHDGAPVAAQLWTVDHGHAIIHKLAYRDDAAAMSPGTVLSAALFRHVIDVDRAETISYGTGDDGYKRDWMDQREQLHSLEFFNPMRVTGLLGMARSSVSRTASALKRRKKN